MQARSGKKPTKTGNFEAPPSPGAARLPHPTRPASRYAAPLADSPHRRRGRVVPDAPASAQVRLPLRRRHSRTDATVCAGPAGRRGGRAGRLDRVGAGLSRARRCNRRPGGHAGVSARPGIPPGAAWRHGRPRGRGGSRLPARPERRTRSLEGAGHRLGSDRGARGGDARAHHAHVRRRAAMRDGAPRVARHHRTDSFATGTKGTEAESRYRTRSGGPLCTR